MKDDLMSRIDDARHNIAGLRLFVILLDAMIVFILFSMVFFFFDIPFYIALAPAALYLTVYSLVTMKERKTLYKIIDKYPSLDERLQTAYDNRGEKNLLIDRLLLDVSQRLESINASAFLETNKVLLRIAVVVILLFASLTINSFEIKRGVIDTQIKVVQGFEDIYSSLDDTDNDGNDPWNSKNTEKSQYATEDEEDRKGQSGGGMLPGYGDSPIASIGGGVGGTANANIYGAPSSAMIEGENVQATIHPEYGGDIEIKDVSSSRIQRTGDVEVSDVKAAATPDKEPLEYEEVIRKYFEKLSRGG